MMTGFFLSVIAALAVIIPLYLYRIVRGPHVFDRLIGLNGIASKAVLLLLIIGVATNQLDMFIDICLGYSLLNMVGALAVGKYLERKGLYE